MSNNQLRIIEGLEKNISMFPEKEAQFVVTRPDGIMIWSNFKDKKRLQELSALGCGLWQSASQMAKFSGQSSTVNVLSFGGSAEGLYATNIKVSEHEYIIFMNYKNTLNPAKLKLKLRALRQLLEDFLFFDKEDEVNNNNQPLSDITDEEMDNLFSFTEV